MWRIYLKIHIGVSFPHTHIRPLQEAKSVKQRFDDLFASSRYVKALDTIRKCKQDKVCVCDIPHLLLMPIPTTHAFMVVVGSTSHSNMVKAVRRE